MNVDEKTNKEKIESNTNAEENIFNKLCPNCNKDVAGNIKFCPHCGLDLSMPQKNSKDTTQNVHHNRPNTNKKPAKSLCTLFSIIFIVLAITFFAIGFDKKNNYYNSEYSTILNKNAYVGGDAYNYIINGNYFTGYMVLGTGCLLCSVILLSVRTICTSNEQKLLLLETIMNKTISIEESVLDIIVLNSTIEESLSNNKDYNHAKKEVNS